MEQKSERLYSSAPLENRNDDLEQRLEKKLNDVNSYDNLTINIKEMITYFRDKIHKFEKKYEIYKTLTSIIESVDTVAIFGSTTTSVTLLVTGVGLIVVPISAEFACALSIGNKILHKIILNRYNEHKKQNQKDQQTI